MKNVFKTLAVALTALVLVSCGGADSAGLVGVWEADPSSLDLTLGDGLAAFKGAIEEQKSEMVSEASEESESITFEFKEDGKLVLSHEDKDETFSFDWSLEGDKLIIEGEVEGEKGKMALTVQSVSADKLTLALTAEDLIAQVKEQMPEAMSRIPGTFDIDAMAKGTSMSISFIRPGTAEDNTPDIKVCYADAYEFAEKQIAGAGQRLISANVTKNDGSYLYYFMSAPLDMSNYCIMVISEHKLKIISTDCGDPYDKQEQWKYIQWCDDPCND